MLVYKNYDVAELYHMFLVEFYFNQDKSNKGAGIFCFKLYYQTQTPDIVVWIMKKEYLGENNLTQKITYL